MVDETEHGNNRTSYLNPEGLYCSSGISKNEKQIKKRFTNESVSHLQTVGTYYCHLYFVWHDSSM